MQDELETTVPEHHSPLTAAYFFRIVFLLIVGSCVAYPCAHSTPQFLEWLNGLVTKSPTPLTSGMPVAIAASAVLGFIIGAGLANLLLNLFLAGMHKVFDRWDHMDSGDKVTLFAGILLGLLATTPLLWFVDQIFSSLAQAYTAWFAIINLGMIVGLCVLITYILQSISEFLPWSQGKGRTRRTGIKILDTNVIIDGRIYDVARTGFLEGNLYVPGFVLDELQYIADSHEALRRQRGRRGLEVLRHMQSEFQMDLRTQDRLAPDLGDGVDARLVRLARAMGADIVTNDFNLNRVAALQEVKVLNINDLALGLRPNVLPSESLSIAVVREGNQPQQGIGYLEDGTMVVVENGKTHIGETLDVVVTQVIQTERGKMIFAEVPEQQPAESNGHESYRKRPTGRRG